MRSWPEPRFDWRHPLSSLWAMWQMRRIRRVFSGETVYHRVIHEAQGVRVVVTFQRGK